MPWRVRDSMSERMAFVERLLAGERMVEVCREFGVSRKTGYKVWQRYQERGREGLGDRSRRPISSPNRTARGVAEHIVALRERHPTWGPKKLRHRLGELHPGVRWPAVSTVGLILKEHGLVKSRVRRRQASASLWPRQESAHPNEVWCIDFKGQFRLGNRRYCYPLTVSDHCSRYLLGCEALADTKTAPVQAVLEEIFREYGLPERMRSDNGSPFASTGRFGLTRLSVWWKRLGIGLERIEPGHPEQNGRHERMHWTLKQEATRPAGESELQQQEKFDRFRREYNEERPHEALGMQTPAKVYAPSLRRYEPPAEPLSYPLHDFSRPVFQDGNAFFPPLEKRIWVGMALVGEHIGFREIEVGTWIASFMDLDLGYVDQATGKLFELPREFHSPEAHAAE